jgi:bacillithiol biosynthesis deacetylase BshB1
MNGCDLLVFAPHPDDAELHAGGTIAAHVRQGAQVVIVDATAGELGSRGDAATRAAEAAAAAAVLGLAARDCLGLPDGGLNAGDLSQRQSLVAALRRHRPRRVLTVAYPTRHPDHQALHLLTLAALKAAALHRLPAPGGEPALGGLRCFAYEAELPIAPALLVPCNDDDWQRKLAAVACYDSQFHQAGRDGPATSISAPGFRDWISARGRVWGQHADSPYAEAYQAPETPRVAWLLES